MPRNEGLSRCSRTPGSPPCKYPWLQNGQCWGGIGDLPYFPIPRRILAASCRPSHAACLHAAASHPCGCALRQRILWSSGCVQCAQWLPVLFQWWSSRLHFARLPSRLLKVARPDPGLRESWRPTGLSFQDTRSLLSSGLASASLFLSVSLVRSPSLHGRPCFFTLLFSLSSFQEVPSSLWLPESCVSTTADNFDPVAYSFDRASVSARQTATACANDAFTSSIGPQITAPSTQRRLYARQTLRRKDSIAWF